MPNYSDIELRNLSVVRQFLNEEPPPADKSELFAEDGVWWNGLPLAHREGRTEHRGRDEIRRLLPSQNTNTALGPGRDKYDMSTAEIADVVMLADGDYVVRQQTFRGEDRERQAVREHLLLRVPIQRTWRDRVPHRALEHLARLPAVVQQLRRGARAPRGVTRVMPRRGGRVPTPSR